MSFVVGSSKFASTLLASTAIVLGLSLSACDGDAVGTPAVKGMSLEQVIAQAVTMAQGAQSHLDRSLWDMDVMCLVGQSGLPKGSTPAEASQSTLDIWFQVTDAVAEQAPEAMANVMSDAGLAGSDKAVLEEASYNYHPATVDEATRYGCAMASAVRAAN